MEEISMGSSLLSYINSIGYPLSGAPFDFSDGAGKSSLGFMELLAVQDPFGPSLFDLPQPSFPFLQPSSASYPTSVVKESRAETAVNNPLTPNSSSITSASSDAVNDEPAEHGRDVNQIKKEKDKTTLKLKANKTNENRQRQRKPRFAFMTKSEVDHLEDGYRWRKYGQKAVKNSSFPRSYYRCTTTTCDVKKHVERCFSNPTIVVTTYEGQHTHPSPVVAQTPAYRYQDHHQPSFRCSSFPLNFDARENGTTNPEFVLQRHLKAASFTDRGLLQDIIPSNCKLKEEN